MPTWCSTRRDNALTKKKSRDEEVLDKFSRVELHRMAIEYCCYLILDFPCNVMLRFLQVIGEYDCNPFYIIDLVVF